MTKKTEALKLAFKQAFDLGQTYWSWADSEYQSHWKKADAAKKRFNQLVEDTIRELLAEQQTDWEAVAADQAMTIGLLKAVQPAQPQQEPVAYRSRIRNRDGQVITAWVVHLEKSKNPSPRYEIESLYTTPPARKPLTHEQRVDLLAKFEPHKHEWHASAILIDMVEAAHGITGENT